MSQHGMLTDHHTAEHEEAPFSVSHTEVPCKYRRLGCNTRLQRSAVCRHEDGEDKLHLHMALNTILTMDRKIADNEYKFENLERKLAISLGWDV